MTSILIDVKKMLGVGEDDTHFDPEIILHTNSSLLALNQLGVGPTNGFMIAGTTETWDDLLGDRIDTIAAKTFLYLKVRLVFDPPTSSFVIEAIKDQIKELEWRLNVQAEKVITV